MADMGFKEIMDTLKSIFHSIPERLTNLTNRQDKLTQEQFKGYQSPLKSWNNSGNYSPGVATDKRHPKGHDGLDMRAPLGSPIYPIAPGTVKSVYTDPKGGLAIVIDHPKSVSSYYAHCNSANVKPNDQVDYDTVIGTVGYSGNAHPSRGGGMPHVHLQTWVNGALTNPSQFFAVKPYTPFDAKKETLILPGIKPIAEKPEHRLANKFRNILFKSALNERQDQLDQLLKDTLAGDRSSFFIFLDLLEEEQPDKKDELSKLTYLQDILKVLSTICPTIIEKINEGEYGFNHNNNSSFDIYYNDNNRELLTYKDYRYSKPILTGLPYFLMFDNDKLFSSIETDTYNTYFEVIFKQGDVSFISTNEDENYKQILDIYKPIADKAETDLAKLKSLLLVPSAYPKKLLKEIEEQPIHFPSNLDTKISKFQSQIKKQAKSQQSEDLLRQALPGDRDAFLIFLDRLEEEDPHARRLFTSLIKKQSSHFYDETSKTIIDDLIKQYETIPKTDYKNRYEMAQIIYDAIETSPTKDEYVAKSYPASNSDFWAATKTENIAYYIAEKEFGKGIYQIGFNGPTEIEVFKEAPKDQSFEKYVENQGWVYAGTIILESAFSDKYKIENNGNYKLEDELDKVELGNKETNETDDLSSGTFRDATRDARKALGLLSTKYPADLSRDGILPDGRKVRLLTTQEAQEFGNRLHRIQVECRSCFKWSDIGHAYQHESACAKKFEPHQIIETKKLKEQVAQAEEELKAMSGDARAEYEQCLFIADLYAMLFRASKERTYKVLSDKYRLRGYGRQAEAIAKEESKSGRPSTIMPLYDIKKSKAFFPLTYLVSTIGATQDEPNEEYELAIYQNGKYKIKDIQADEASPISE